MRDESEGQKIHDTYENKSRQEQTREGRKAADVGHCKNRATRRTSVLKNMHEERQQKNSERRE
jgi:hypothetical protein